jgi:hypothetical protein
VIFQIERDIVYFVLQYDMNHSNIGQNDHKISASHLMIKRRMNTTTTLVYDTLKSLAAHAPEQHAEIRQRLYEQLSLPFNKQLSLYANVLGPISSGKLAGCDNIDKAVELALDVLEGRNK